MKKLNIINNFITEGEDENILDKILKIIFLVGFVGSYILLTLFSAYILIKDFFTIFL